MNRLRFALSTASLALAALFAGGCATEPSLHSGKTGYYAYTWEQELELGKKSDAGIIQEMGLYPDDALADYVNELGNTILAESAIRSEDAPELYRETEFTFRLMDSPVVNAFALPGGYVYVTRGLLAHIENEAQLAVVIGHEITHVEARHASKQALKQQFGQIGLLAGAVIGEQIAENKEFARQMVDLSGDLFQLVTLKYGRDAERESDLHGVEYAAKAGYDAAQGSAFFKSLDRISEKSGQSIPSWMSTHPDPGERENTIKQLAKQWSDPSGRPNEVGRERFLEKIDGMVIGDNPRNGYADQGYFYHPDLKFQFATPNQWRVLNETSAVYLVDPSQNAIVAVSIAKEDSLIAAAQALQNKLSLTASYAQEKQINGHPAYVVDGSLSGSSENINVSATFISYDSNVYTFLGYGNSATYAANVDQIRSIANSFQELTNPSILNIQPARISIQSAPRSAPFQELLPNRLPSGTDPIDWAIMNQVELDERIEKGRLLKLPSTQS